MDRKELIAAVKVEAANLRKYATKEELNRLDFNTFSTSLSKSCVYGQMTGNCFSYRSSQLIGECAPFTLRSLAKDSLYDNIKLFNSNLSDRLVWSPIENYIFLDSEENSEQWKFQNTQNKKLISYLKGETDELNLE